MLDWFCLVGLFMAWSFCKRNSISSKNCSPKIRPDHKYSKRFTYHTRQFLPLCLLTWPVALIFGDRCLIGRIAENEDCLWWLRICRTTEDCFQVLEVRLADVVTVGCVTSQISGRSRNLDRSPRRPQACRIHGHIRPLDPQSASPSMFLLSWLLTGRYLRWDPIRRSQLRLARRQYRCKSEPGNEVFLLGR